jgi:RNA polymerase sigma-70 factor (ECF subfamily)
VTTDWERLDRARRGDESAWRELIERHQPRLMSLALMITGSISTAEDIVQETFMRAINAKIKHNDGTVQGFMGTIAYRLAIKENGRSRRHEEIGSADLVDNKRDILENVLMVERDRHITEVIHNLDSKYREVLILKYYAGHTYEEIAELLRIPLGTVKSRMFYAVKTCRDILKDKGILS